MEKETSCHVAGLIKGLIEKGDPIIHFGSLINLDFHIEEAKRLGLIEGDDNLSLKVTDYGRKAYSSWGIENEEGRAYLWKKQQFILPEND